MSIATSHAEEQGGVIVEPYRHYRFDAGRTTTRTDTPDLLGAFRSAMESAGWNELDALSDGAHADLFEASKASLPE